MRHRLELRDSELSFVALLDDRAQDISWGFDPIGGCSEIKFKIASKYCTELDVGQNFNLKLYLRNEETKNYDLVYQGRIETTSVSINNPETMEITGFGYQSQLVDIIVNQNFTSTEISVIVKTLLDNYVVTRNYITYDAADIEATGYTPDSIKFEYATAQECFDKLASLGGNVEWGVDKNNKFYFRQRSTVTGFRYFSKDKRVLDFKLGSSSREVANRIIVIGGQSGGSKFVRINNYQRSQNKFGIRDKIIQNAGVTTNEVADQLSDAYYEDHKGSVDRGSIKINDGTIFEKILPVKLLEIVSRETLYDEKEYDTFLYAGQDPYRIRRILYDLNSENDLVANLELGAALPDPVVNIKQLEYNIEQISQRS